MVSEGQDTFTATSNHPESDIAPVTISDEGTDVNQQLFSRHQNLLKWLWKHGGYLHSNVQISYLHDKGFHAVTAKGNVIEESTRIASCPMSLTLSVLNAIDADPFVCHGTKFPDTFLYTSLETPEQLQAFYLMDQYIYGDKSWWAPYINTLPTLQDIQDLQFDDNVDLLWLEGTNLKTGLSTQTMKWKDMYDRGLSQLKKLHWPHAVDDRYTWELFRWAATIFGSRSFTSRVLTDTLPADKARPAGRKDANHFRLAKLFGDQFAVLLPVLDLLNHKPMAKIEWQARSSFVGLQVLQTYKSGQELCNNYGPRDNEGLLLAYGFVIPDNAFDHVVVGIKAPPGSPLADARTWTADPRADTDHKCYVFNTNHPLAVSASCLESSVFSFDLLDSISVLSGNDRELQVIYTAEQTLISACLDETNQFEDFRNLLSALSQLSRDCDARASRLRTTDPSRSSPPQHPFNQKQQNAKIYRDSQLSILETAVIVCHFVLVRACTNIRLDDLVGQFQARLPSETFTRLETLVCRNPCFSRPHELFPIQQMLKFLPETIITQWHTLTDQLRNNLRATTANAPLIQNELNMTKIKFAVLLSALCSAYNDSMELPDRPTRWIQELSQWYPPGDDNWSYIPQPGPWQPGEEPPPALLALLAATSSMTETHDFESNVKKWLQPEMLCWAWNVMEEEGVIVPKTVLEMAYPDEPIQDEVGFLLYCKQY